MKKLTILPKLMLVSAVSFLSACDNMTVTTGDGTEKVEANGKPGIAQRDLASFSSINLEGVFNIFLLQGDKESVKIEADENILPMVLTSVDNDLLSIKMKENTTFSKAKKINVYITFVDVSKIMTDGVGTLNCSGNLKFRDIEFNCKGVGATRLDLTADKLRVKTEIVGAMFLKGTAAEVSIDHKGVGAIEAFELIAEKLTLVSDGVATAEVYASKELNVKASGLGGVKYKGNPAIRNIEKDGLGKIASVQ